MNCTEARAHLDAYLDGQLTETEARQVADHLATCAECSTALERRRALGELLHRDIVPRAAPDALRQRVARSFDGASAPAPNARRRWSVGPIVAIAASLLVAIGATWEIASRQRSGDDVADEVFTAHVRSLIGTHLTDVVSSDQHTVKPWFNGKLDYSPTVTDFAAEGYPLVGGRLEFIDGKRVAALVYARRQHTINVFVWPESGTATSEADVTRQGYHIVHWTAGGYVWWVVSDLERTEFDGFVGLEKK